MKRWLLTGLLALSMSAVAQDATETVVPEPVAFHFAFPLAAPSQEQIGEAYDCDLETAPATGDLDSLTTCEMAVRALEMAAERGESKPISDDEIALFTRLVEANSALVLRLSLIATYFGAIPLVAAPDFAEQTVTSVHLTYTFSGLGPSNNYDIVIDMSGETPAVTGTAEISGESDDPLDLPDSVAVEVVQALLPALSDLLPIAEQFSSVACWDYYPDWVVELTLEDGTVIAVVNNESNVVGIGGPWQVEIDGQNYMQYSNAFSAAVIDLLDALSLPLGETAAMGCGGVTDPLWDAFPRDPDA